MWRLCCWRAALEAGECQMSAYGRLRWADLLSAWVLEAHRGETSLRPVKSSAASALVCRHAQDVFLRLFFPVMKQVVSVHNPNTHALISTHHKLTYRRFFFPNTSIKSRSVHLIRLPYNLITHNSCWSLSKEKWGTSRTTDLSLSVVLSEFHHFVAFCPLFKPPTAAS